MEAPEMSKAGFRTPENQIFYEQRPYLKLNSERKEIRLLRVQHARMTVFEVQEKWPEWSNRIKSMRKPQEPPDEDTTPYTAPAQLPKGWEAFSSSKTQQHCNYDSDGRASLYAFKKPYYFNIYTGQSQWLPPTKSLGSLIVCELIDATPLRSVYGRHTKYATLSYCAGDHSQTTPIIVNGLIFNAFRNLEHSLECIRQYWSENSSEDLLMWIDQVCINQSDLQEKSCQVDMMGEIFKRCWQTFACLSTATGSADLSPVSSIRGTFSSTSTVGLFSSMTATSLQADLQILRNYLEDRWPGEVPRANTSPESLLGANSADYSTKSTTSSIIRGLGLISSIVAAPWWSRAWVFQELILPSRMSVFYHEFCGRWSDLGPVISCFCKHRDAIIQDLNDIADTKREHEQRKRRAYTSHEQRSKRSSFLESLVKRYTSAREVSVLPTPPRGDCFSAKRLISRTAPIDLTRALYAVSAKISWDGSYGLRAVAENMHRFLATDPRDLVYAFLGLIGPDWDIKSNYSPHVTLHHVLVAITKRLVRHENRLDILIDALRRSGEFGFQLPSWVPDWTVPRSSTIQPPLELRGSQRKFRASKSTKAEAVFHAPQGETLYILLEVIGIEGDTLCQVEQDTYGDEQYFRSLGGRLIFTSSSAQVGDKIWVIHGADPVFVLRHDKEDCYVLISIAFVIDDIGGPARFSPIMHGELVDQEEKGEISSRSIYLL